MEGRAAAGTHARIRRATRRAGHQQQPIIRSGAARLAEQQRREKPEHLVLPANLPQSFSVFVCSVFGGFVFFEFPIIFLGHVWCREVPERTPGGAQ